MLTLYKRRIILIVSALAFLIITPILLLYTLGYRIDSSFKIARTGGIYIYSPVSGSEIFIKNKFEKKTNLIQSGFFLQNRSVGYYPVLVTKEGYWPWLKDLPVYEGMVAEARAVLIPKNPEGNVLLKGNFSALWASPYQKILLIEENKTNGIYANFYLPETNTFLTSTTAGTNRLLTFKNGITKIFWEKEAVLLKGDNRVVRATLDFSSQTVKASIESINDFPVNNKVEKISIRQKEHLWQDNKANAIWIEWLGEKKSIPYYLCDTKPCENATYLISNFIFPVKNTDFFPERRDVVLVAVYNTVFALEIDGRGGRLSFPIYKGRNPTFAVFPNVKKVFVLDDGNLSAINLE